MKHTLKLAEEVMALIEPAGIKTQLIGSVKKTGVSEHDIDFVVLNMVSVGSELIHRLQLVIHVLKFTATDNGGLFVETLGYGNLDFFPSTFLKSNCAKCTKRCCALM